MKNIKIYTSPTCTFCHQLKAWLQEKNVAFTEFDVFADEDARDFIVRKSGQMGVPVSLVTDEESGNEEIVVGFDTPKLTELLGL